MKLFAALLGTMCAIFSTAILLYISLATGLGPWMAPTLVLLAGIIIRTVSRSSEQGRVHDMVIIQTIGSVGGSVATAVGFCLPTLYFLQPELFAQWMAAPAWFSVLLTSIVGSAGWWGIWLARQQAPALLADESLRFPVSVAIVDTIESQAQSTGSRLLAAGAGFSWIISFMRDGWGRIAPLIAKNSFTAGLLPVSWAIGFLAGMPIVLPIVMGMICRFVVIVPMTPLFAPLSAMDVTFAFCSGIVLSQTVESMATLPRLFREFGSVASWQSLATAWSGYRLGGRHGGNEDKEISLQGGGTEKMSSRTRSGIYNFLYIFLCRFEGLLAGLASIATLTYLGFPPLAQLMLLGLSVVMIRHLNAFACRTGLGAYGRYMTFTMVPIMMATAVSHMHITMLCLFIGIAGAAGVDLLFDYRVGQKTGVSAARIHRAQLLGLMVTAACMGMFFWFLCTHFQLGSADLIAHRSRARALLLNSFHMHWGILAIGALFGILLKRVRINPILAFGGVIMPPHLVIGFGFGSLVRLYTRNAERYTPFWSGVFTGDALWVLAMLLGR